MVPTPNLPLPHPPRERYLTFCSICLVLWHVMPIHLRFDLMKKYLTEIKQWKQFLDSGSGETHSLVKAKIVPEGR